MDQSEKSQRAVAYICATADEIAKVKQKLSSDGVTQGFEIMEFYMDSHPSSRPGLRHFLNSLDSLEIDAVLVMQLWELGQSVPGLLKNLHYLLDNGLRVIAGGQDIKREQLPIIQSVLESEMVYRIQQSNSGQQRWVMAGNRVGRPKAQFSMTDALALRATGTMSPTQISRELMKKGQNVSPTTLRRRFAELETAEV